MLRIVSILLLAAAVCICGCMGASESGAGEQIAWNLTVAGDTEEVLTLAELRALPAEEGYGYAVSTVGITFGPNRYRGVLVTDLALMAGGVDENDLVYVSAEDGYLWVFDTDQVRGKGFFTFDENLREIPAPPLRVILAYEQDGRPLTYEEGGPLRIVIITESPDVITEGSSWVKWVDRVEVHRR